MLLEFAALPEKSRREFLTSMNEFLLMSPAQKRRAISEWKSRADGHAHDLPVNPDGR
ncbi:hypothetical protein OHZ10_20030 [Burkholderia arboris]|uniref:Uncharacterized protein n=1 Tax=Burkholderia arboris TaxID=488730 RepID=A0ABZ3DT39_9BURK|nr:hypothetical protein [Burkholderia arboris]MCA8490383.1 hypothetical protein [Burkholderia arboris]